MTVSTLRKPADQRPLVCTWVPVRGADGRTRMEMRWESPDPHGRHIHHAA